MIEPIHYCIHEKDINNFFEKNKDENFCEYIKTIDYPFSAIGERWWHEPVYCSWHAITFVIYKLKSGKYVSKIESAVERFNIEPKEFDTLIEAVDYIYYAFMQYRPPFMRFKRVDDSRIKIPNNVSLPHTPKWFDKYDEITEEIKKIAEEINKTKDENSDNYGDFVLLAISRLKLMLEGKKVYD